ncbi:YvcK family protein [Patescibacteria group bacterium]|nr:YvcK family protein [Patescibacteria group bacterium]
MPKKIVVIGGGTGSAVVLSGLREYPVDLTAIVAVTDSGGSTGRLRTEFGFLPVGDMRQCLAALAKGNKSEYIRKLLLYRFDKGKGLEGHNLGNLILTALTDISSSEPKAVEVAAQIFRLEGRILPITTKNIQLMAVYENGKTVIGEHEIDEPKQGGKRIIKLLTKPEAVIYKEAKKAILAADLIILGPGDLYTSILPNLIINGVRKTFLLSKAKVVYIVNLMTRFGQTHNLSANDHVQEIERYLGKKPDFVLFNNRKIPEKILQLYKKEKGFPTKDDIKGKIHYKLIRGDFLAPELVIKPKGDVKKRSFLRHNSKKLAKTIISLLK